MYYVYPSSDLSRSTLHFCIIRTRYQPSSISVIGLSLTHYGHQLFQIECRFSVQGQTIVCQSISQPNSEREENETQERPVRDVYWVRRSTSETENNVCRPIVGGVYVRLPLVGPANLERLVKVYGGGRNHCSPKLLHSTTADCFVFVLGPEQHHTGITISNCDQAHILRNCYLTY